MDAWGVGVWDALLAVGCSPVGGGRPLCETRMRTVVVGEFGVSLKRSSGGSCL